MSGVTVAPFKNDFVLVQDLYGSGTVGHTYVTSVWNTCPLNNKLVDLNGIATLAANQVTLPPGTYWCQGFANVSDQNAAGWAGRLRVRNVTGGSTAAQGVNANYNATNSRDVPLHVQGVFTLAASATLELQVYPTATINSAAAAITSGDPEVYASIMFWRFQ